MRLFFAVWPDEAAARSLETLALALADVAGGKPVPREKVHLTLAFLGEVAADRVESAVAAGARARGAPFPLRLDEVGSFRRAAVAWAGCKRSPAGLVSLQSDLTRSLAERGFTLEDRPYAPHVTLARRIREPVPPAPTEAIAWHVRDVTLVRSEVGTGRYAVLERWPLGA
jgi:2'-5' RNA ligase